LGNVPDAQHLQAVIQRRATHLPDHVRVHAYTLSGTIRIDESHHVPPPAGMLEPFRQAIADARVLFIRYRGNSQDELTEREVEPEELLRRDGYWYLVGYCRLRSERRTFRLDRIQAYDVRSEVFYRDSSDLDAYLDETFGMHWDERPHTVKIRFSAYQARWINEVQWHPTEIKLLHDDGRLDLTMTVTGLDDVCRWVMQYGSQAEVISPPMLRNKVAREARRMHDKYNTDGAS